MVVDLNGYNGLINTHGYTGAGREKYRPQEYEHKNVVSHIICSEEKRFVKILIMIPDQDEANIQCVLNHNNEKQLASITQCWEIRHWFMVLITSQLLHGI